MKIVVRTGEEGGKVKVREETFFISFDELSSIVQGGAFDKFLDKLPRFQKNYLLDTENISHRLTIRIILHTLTKISHEISHIKVVFHT